MLRASVTHIRILHLDMKRLIRNDALNLISSKPYMMPTLNHKPYATLIVSTRELTEPRKPESPGPKRARVIMEVMRVAV